MTKQIDFSLNPDKRAKRIYWIMTAIAMALIVLPSYFAPRAYLVQAVKSLQFPDYFPLELDILKIVGALLILVPAIPTMFKEWAYVGFGILLLSASLAHGIVDGFVKGISPLIPFAVLVVSYYYFRKLNYER